MRRSSASFTDGQSQQVFAGAIDGKPWLYSRRPTCRGPENRCMNLVGLVLPPVSLLLEKTQDGNVGVSAEFDRDTDHAAITLTHGEIFTVTALPADTSDVGVINSTYFELPPGETVTNVVAYRKDGTEIGHSDPRPLRSDIPTDTPWYLPDGSVFSRNPMTVRVASGGDPWSAWTLDILVGTYDGCAKLTTPAGSEENCSVLGWRTDAFHFSDGSVKYAVYGNAIEHGATRIDIRLSDGTTLPIVPMVFGDRSFAGTMLPNGATVKSVVQYDASGKTLSDISPGGPY